MSMLRVGAASTVLTPELGLPMAGYAAREGNASGVLDDLRWQAVVLTDRDTTLVLAVCDLLYLTHALATEVRAALGAALGVPPHHVMLAATHTHCGPSSIAAAGPLVSYLKERAVAAVVEAHERTVPARLVTGERSVSGVACNRRDGGEVPDETVRVVAALPETGDGDAIATVVGFACHPTVLDHETCAYSADFPGAVRRTVADLCGGEVVFLQGCAGDVNPSFTAHTAAETRRVGGIVGAGVAECVLRLMRTQPRVIDLSLGVEVPVETGVVGGAVAPAPLAAAMRTVPAQARVRPPYDEVRRERAAAGDTGPRAAELWIEELFATEPEQFDAVLDRPGGDPGALPVQAFQLGAGLSVVALPGEPFTATGQAIRDAVTGTVLVAGYANEATGYLPTRAEFGRGGYEAGCAEYAPGTAEAVTAAAGELVAELESRS